MKLAALVLAAGCSQHVYSPPTQAFAILPVHATGTGEAVLDLDASTHSQVFDPGYDAASARIRAGLGNDTEVSVEAMQAYVNAGGPSPANRNVYAGRAALRFNPLHGAFSFNVGAGGGFAPASGSFAAIDGGLSVGYDNCYVVPMASYSMFVSQPIDPKPVDVSEDSAGETFSTPSRTAGGTFRTGIRISLSPDSCRARREVPWITAGFDFTSLIDATSNAQFMGAGVGLTIPLR